MRLRGQVRLARYGCWAAAVALFGVAANVEPTPFYAAVVPIGLLVYAGSQAWLFIVTRAVRRMNALIAAERFDEADQLLVEIEEISPPHPLNDALNKLSRASLLLGQGRAPEAVRVLDSVRPRVLSPMSRAYRLNNLAWALVESGNGARALSVATESAGVLDTPDTGLSGAAQTLRGVQIGTLGAAHVVAGKYDEAIPLLERALRFGGKPPAQAARYFYLGKAAHALGRHEEASRAWSTAAALTPTSRFMRLSAAALETLTTDPYRSPR